MIIKEIYKENEITASTWYLPDSQQWKPLVIILEVKTGLIYHPDFVRTFPIEREAERKALLSAKLWIDGGKPPLHE